MADDQDDSQKTEDPTQRRIEEAVKKGQVASSREVTNFLMLVTLTLSIVMLAPYVMREATLFLSKYITQAHDISLDTNSYHLVFTELFKGIVVLIMLPIGATVIVAFLSSLLQNGFIISTEPITPKLEKISVLKGLKRMFSMKSFMEFIKGIIKITVVGVVATISIWPELGLITNLHDYDVGGIMAVLKRLSIKMLLGVCLVMAVIAVLDFLYQKFEYLKSMRMSKQDLKDEYKQSEGNPEIKAKLRNLRMERARNRMMADVPNADVIITNPTHFAVALQYDTASHAAPMLIAKGADKVAFRIREVGEENDVPIVQNPPLTRALYEAVDINEQIPEEHFKAVAEIIAYVYKLKGKNNAA